MEIIDVARSEFKLATGRTRVLALSRFHGRSAGSAAIGPGDLATRIRSAIGPKSARKCTELLFTRIFIFSGWMPAILKRLRSFIGALTELTATLTSSMRKQTV